MSKTANCKSSLYNDKKHVLLNNKQFFNIQYKFEFVRANYLK